MNGSFTLYLPSLPPPLAEKAVPPMSLIFFPVVAFLTMIYCYGFFLLLSPSFSFSLSFSLFLNFQSLACAEPVSWTLAIFLFRCVEGVISARLMPLSFTSCVGVVFEERPDSKKISLLAFEKREREGWRFTIVRVTTEHRQFRNVVCDIHWSLVLRIYFLPLPPSQALSSALSYRENKRDPSGSSVNHIFNVQSSAVGHFLPVLLCRGCSTVYGCAWKNY